MKKEKMNDKGFSLVELIIVIAIMAVLVVVLAPQYLKYVERSRNSTDLQNATSVVTACQVYAADPEANPNFQEGGFKVTVSSSGATVGAGTGTDMSAVANAALTSAGISTTDLKCKSKTKWTQYTIVGTISSTGEISFDYECDKGTAFKDAMAGNTTTPSGSGS